MSKHIKLFLFNTSKIEEEVDEEEVDEEEEKNNNL